MFIPAWYLLLAAVLWIQSCCQSVRYPERFDIRHHSVLSEALCIEFWCPSSVLGFRYFFRQVDVAALCAAIRDWIIAQAPGGAPDLDHLCVTASPAGRDSAHGWRRLGLWPRADYVYISQVSLYSVAMGFSK